MSAVEVQYRDHRRKVIEAMVARLAGLEIAVGFQGEAAARRVSVRKRVVVPRKDGNADRRYKRPRTGMAEGKITLAALALIHEFGAPAAHIPERSFIRSAMSDSSSRIKGMVAKITKAAAVGDPSVPFLLERLAVYLEGIVKRRITEIRSPPMAKSTFDRRVRQSGDAWPKLLVDTGSMRQGVTAVVRRRRR